MAIWFKDYTLEDLKNRELNTLSEFIGMEFIEIGDNFLVARLQLDNRTRQPTGLMHGAAFVVMGETTGSTGACLTVDPSKHVGVGMEINANHIRAVRNGFVTARATPLHLGRVSQVWEIKISQDKHLVSICRHTVAIVKRR